MTHCGLTRGVMCQIMCLPGAVTFWIFIVTMKIALCQERVMHIHKNLQNKTKCLGFCAKLASYWLLYFTERVISIFSNFKKKYFQNCCIHPLNQHCVYLNSPIQACLNRPLAPIK